MSNTAQIEHQAESHRAHVADLVGELRARATPGEVLDQLLGWEDGREIARTFGNQIRNNPLPLALIGTGVAWLMISDSIHGGQPRLARTNTTNAGAPETSAMGRSVAEKTRSASEWSRETASDALNRATSTVDSARNAAANLADSTQAALSTARQSVADTAAGAMETASDAWQQTSGAAQNTADSVRQAGSSLNGIAREQPLLVAGIGLAVGMALGAILPASDAENRILGERADALKNKAGELAEEGYRNAKAVAQRSFEAAADAAKDEAQRQGLASDSESAEAEGDKVEHFTEPPAEPVRPESGNGGDYGSSAYSHH